MRPSIRSGVTLWRRLVEATTATVIPAPPTKKLAPTMAVTSGLGPVARGTRIGAAQASAVLHRNVGPKPARPTTRGASTEPIRPPTAAPLRISPTALGWYRSCSTAYSRKSVSANCTNRL